MKPKLKIKNLFGLMLDHSRPFRVKRVRVGRNKQRALRRMETRSADYASLIRPASTDCSWRQAAGKGEWVALRLTHSRELLMARRARATCLPLSHDTSARFRALHRGRRELHLEPFQVIHLDARDHEIAEPFVVGGQHGPGRVVGTAAVDCVVVGVLILVPRGALAMLCLG